MCGREIITHEISEFCVGPFVMTTQDEIRQAIIDYHSRQNGFEHRRD